MKIIEREQGEPILKVIEVGEVFKFEDRYWLKTDYEKNGHLCVNLETGETQMIQENAVVKKVAETKTIITN